MKTSKFLQDETGKDYYNPEWLERECLPYHFAECYECLIPFCGYCEDICRPFLTHIYRCQGDRHRPFVVPGEGH